MNRSQRIAVSCLVGGLTLATTLPASATPPAQVAVPATAHIQNPIAPNFRVALRQARFGCLRQRDPRACQRLKQLRAERRRLLKAHRAELRARRYLPLKRVH